MSYVPIRIILVDDHYLMREAWRMMLGNNPDFHVIAACENGQSAIEQAVKHKPDIMLVDINMSPLNGFTTTKRILETNPAIKIIGISVNNEPKYALRMVEFGAIGYLTKTSPVEEIIHGIMKVHAGEMYICKEIRKNILPSQ
jgi:two-component system, NarL family, invasion response regulator UvrY